MCREEIIPHTIGVISLTCLHTRMRRGMRPALRYLELRWYPIIYIYSHSWIDRYFFISAFQLVLKLGRVYHCRIQTSRSSQVRVCVCTQYWSWLSWLLSVCMDVFSPRIWLDLCDCTFIKISFGVFKALLPRLRRAPFGARYEPHRISLVSEMMKESSASAQLVPQGWSCKQNSALQLRKFYLSYSKQLYSICNYHGKRARNKEGGTPSSNSCNSNTCLAMLL